MPLSERSSAVRLLEARGIDKRFPGVHALDGADFACDRGRVHALVGENGAGKSTLTKVISGVYRPDEGQLLLDGEPVTFRGPRDAMDAGIAMVHQELTLLPDLSVAENILLGHEPASAGVLRGKEMAARAGALLEELGGGLSLSTPARRLSVAQQQIVEIAKALAYDARLLIMDEPSAVLGGSELDRLFDVIGRLAERGVAVVYISHRLAEVEAIADDVTVMRDGAVMWTGPRGDTDQAQMVRHMVGRSLDQAFPPRRGQIGGTVLEVEGLMLPGTEPNGLSLTVRAGEIVGVAGMMGSGRSRLARALVGLEPARGGTVAVGGRRIERLSPRAASANGLALIPEDRKGMGLVLDFSVAENLSLPLLERISRLRVISREAERSLATDSIDELSIRASGPDQHARVLSGGNQQKVVLGKWLATKPAVLVLDEPLRGVDVGAKAEIYELIRSLAAGGVAVLLISSELTEILGLSDRVLVMRDGRIVEALDGGEATDEKIIALAVGEDPS